MTYRKGQHLFNELCKRNPNMTNESFHQVVFYMSDKEFDEIMKDWSYQNGDSMDAHTRKLQKNIPVCNNCKNYKHCFNCSCWCNRK